MFNSPISKSQEELVHAARTATTDYIQNGTDLTEAVVKAASAIQPLTQEHVRRICEMTYHDAYERLFAEKTGMYQYVTFDPPDAIKASEMLDAIQMEVAHQPLLNKLASTQMDKKESDKYATRNKEASFEQTKIASMPSKFQRMNTHELWVKAASGNSLPDHNPTRELQQVHRDLKDSISTVKSDLYSAEQNEKLAMIDMVKQAKAGLSAGHSMEQVLHAALSVVDTTEPFMAKTAHDLCATIIEACADHQNSGFSKEASFLQTLALNPNKEELDKAFAHFEKTTGKHRKHMSQKDVYDYVVKQRGMGKEAKMFMRPQEGMANARENSKGWQKNPMKLIYNFDHKKEATALQEVNPNHPIPQKFKKLAEANIQRKHLEVTLDELNRNMNYFNEQLKNELFR
jgi:hypothetical protein